MTIPRMFSYQGRLTDSSGDPVRDSSYSVTFRLFTQSSGGIAFWSENRTIQTRSGLFSIILGHANAITQVPENGVCFIELQVNPDPPLSPRSLIVSNAYSYLARKADTANYALNAVGVAWVSGGDSVLYTSSPLGVARGGAANMLHGGNRYTHVNLGIACTTGTSGGSSSWNSVLGYKNVASGSGGVTVAGGQYNRAGGFASFVGGGYNHLVDGRTGVVAGGRADTVQAEYGAVLGGWKNRAGNQTSDTGAAVVGGFFNRVTNKYGFIGGGSGNVAEGMWSTVGGGGNNRASNYYSTIGGGFGNRTNDYYASVLGGYGDTATGNSSVVAGGAQNVVSGDYSAIVGGTNNRITGTYSFAFGRSVAHNQSYTATFFDGAHYGNFLINRSGYSNSGRTIEVGTERTNGNAAYLWYTGMWTDVGKRSDWEASVPLDGQRVLERIDGLDIGLRRFKDDGGECIAPDGDEFSSAFAFRPGGATPGSGAISPLDVASVALVAIKELNRKLAVQQAEIEALKAALAGTK
ncbi:MAG: hypothetical protein R6X13_09510 [bacterium]